MNNTYPYEKDIKFDTKIAEIESISLEHELEVNENEITGNFIVAGTYKSHEISVNTEDFLYKLPFSVDVTENIIKESLEFEITDFTYEIKDENILRVNISFSVNAEEKEEIEEKEEEKDANTLREEINTIVREELSKKEEEKEIEEKTEETPIDEERMDSESQEIVMNSAKTTIEEYMTYNIHIVKELDTLESICNEYETDIALIKEYNNIEELKIGDKIIIPINEI